MINLRPFNIADYPCSAENIKIYSDGCGLIPEGEFNELAVIDNTSLEEYSGYLQILRNSGLLPSFYKEQNGNVFASFKCGEGILYTYYIEHLKQVKLISDTVSASEDEFSVKDISGKGKARLFSFPVTEGHQGDLYFISLPNGQWIIIDGSHDPENQRLSEKLFDFLMEHNRGEKLHIACWWITHGHRDHFKLFHTMIENHSDSFVIDRIMFNEACPTYIKDGNYDEFVEFRKDILARYPEILFLKPHTGMNLKFGAVEFEFLYAQEDNIFRFAADKDSVPYPLNDFNLSSSIARVDIDGMSVLMLGDQFNIAEFIPKAYSESTYLCDIYKCAHHGFNRQHLDFYLETAKTGKIKYFLINNDRGTIDPLKRFDAIENEYGERMIFTVNDIRCFERCGDKIIVKNYPFIEN